MSGVSDPMYQAATQPSDFVFRYLNNAQDKEKSPCITRAFQTVDKLDENRVCLFLWLGQFGR